MVMIHPCYAILWIRGPLAATGDIIYCCAAAAIARLKCAAAKAVNNKHNQQH